MLKATVLFIFLLAAIGVKAQIYPSPIAIKINNAFVGITTGQSVDSVFYPPTGCGVPTDTTFLHAQQNGGRAQKLRKWAIYYDSCGHHAWNWDPSLQRWHIADSSSGGGSGTVTGVIISNDSVYYTTTSGKTFVYIAITQSDSTVKYVTPTQLNVGLAGKYGPSDTGYTKSVATPSMVGKVTDSMIAVNNSRYRTPLDTTYAHLLMTRAWEYKVVDSMNLVYAARFITQAFGANFLGIGAYASRPVGSGSGLYAATDSLGLFITTNNGSTYTRFTDQAGKLFNLYAKRDGARGIMMGRGADSSFYFKGLVDSLDLHCVLNPDSTVTCYVGLIGSKGSRVMTDPVTGRLVTQAEILHSPARLKTAAALPANTYNNGTAGVGATLTGNSNGALTVDAVSVAVNDRILVANEVTQANNGIYTVTQAGSGSLPYILTRGSYSAIAANMIAGSHIYIQSGTANFNTVWYQQTTGTITFGTTALVYAQTAGSGGGADSSVVSGSKAITKTVSGTTITLKGDGTVFYPEDFGAVADGVTDNVTAIRACFAVAGNKGGIVQFSQGIYISSDSINVPPYVSVIGLGGNNLGANLISANSILPALTTVTFTSPTHNGFVCGNDSGTTSPQKTGYNFSNLRIHYGGSSTPTAGAGILFGDGGNYTMNNVTVDSFFDDVYSRVACYENVTNCIFYSPARYGFVCTNLFNGDFMDINMAGCLFLSGKSYPRPLAGFYSNSPGGIKIINSKWCIPIIDTSKTFRWAIKLDNTFDVSQDILLSNLSIEAFDSSAIVMNFSNTSHQRLAILSNIQTYTIAQAIAPAIVISAPTPVGTSGGVIVDNIVASNTVGGLNTSFAAVQISGMSKVTIGKIIDYFYSATAGPWTAVNNNPAPQYAYILNLDQAHPTATSLISNGAMNIVSDNTINTGGGGDPVTIYQGGNGSAALALQIDSLHQVDINPGGAIDANRWLLVRKDTAVQVNVDVVNKNTSAGAGAAFKLFTGSVNSELVSQGPAGPSFGLLAANNLGLLSNNDIAIFSWSGANAIKFSAKAAGTEAARFASSNNFLMGTTTDVPTSIFTMASTTQGFLAPRMNTTQQNAISSPATGLTIWNTDSIDYCVYTGSAWRIISYLAAGGGTSPPFSDASALFKNSTDATKLIKFDLSGITTGTTRTWAYPDFNGTFAATNHAQAFTGAQDFTGATITVPNQTAHDSSTKAAPTAYVDAAVSVATSPASHVIFSATAQGTALTNSTSTASIIGTGVGSKTVASGGLTAGKTIIMHGYLVYSTGATNTQITLSFSTSSFSTNIPLNLPASQSNAVAPIDIMATVLSTGSSGTMAVEGFITVGGAAQQICGSTLVTGFNTTISQTFDVTAAWTTASTSNSINMLGNFSIKVE